MMHVTIFGFCGAAGLIGIYRNFTTVRNAVSDPTVPSRRAAADHLLKVWMLLYMFVGTQMAFNLAPFINTSGPIAVFHSQQGNFYTYVWSNLLQLFP